MLLFFSGTPLYSWYLRALGAKVGRDVAVFVRQVPVSADLLTIGDGTVIRKDVLIGGYRARDGQIEIDRITFGRDVVVGEAGPDERDVLPRSPGRLAGSATAPTSSTT
jgi:acetyltransferase-like isoleucine patch superfamily enzyme